MREEVEGVTWSACTHIYKSPIAYDIIGHVFFSTTDISVGYFYEGKRSVWMLNWLGENRENQMRLHMLTKLARLDEWWKCTSSVWSLLFFSSFSVPVILLFMAYQMDHVWIK